MNINVKKEILYDLAKTIEILEVREAKDLEELKSLSDHAIEDVALHKDLDLISVTVLIYSLYKMCGGLAAVDYNSIVAELRNAQQTLQQGNLSKYNRSIKTLYVLVQRCNVKVQEHLQDVMQAARIKKGTALLEKGLSIGQAAGLMGLSNWDLQQYAAKTVALAQHAESIPAAKRLKTAFSIFKIST